jgi:hypothetical protein
VSSEMCSECDGYEVVIVDGEEVHCATCSLRAEVEQLRDWHSEMFQYAADRDAEIERLRRLGDTLAHHVRAGESKEMYSAVHAWEEARRER